MRSKKQILLCNFIKTILNEAVVYQRIKNYDEAEAVFEKFIEKFKNDVSFELFAKEPEIEEGKRIWHTIEHTQIFIHFPQIISSSNVKVSFINMNTLTFNFRWQHASLGYKGIDIKFDDFKRIVNIANTFKEFKILLERIGKKY